MAFKMFKLFLLVAFVGLFCLEAGAQSTSSITTCASSVMSLSPCTSNNTRSSTRPSSACCAALTNLVQTNPECLCSVLNTGAGSVVGMVIPLTLPSSCNIQTSALSQCSASPPSPPPTPSAISPTTTPLADTPTGSPNDVQPEAPSSDFPTGSGTDTIPNFGTFSDGSITKASLHVVLLVISISSWVSVVALY